MKLKQLIGSIVISLMLSCGLPSPVANGTRLVHRTVMGEDGSIQDFGLLYDMKLQMNCSFSKGKVNSSNVPKDYDQNITACYPVSVGVSGGLSFDSTCVSLIIDASSVDEIGLPQKTFYDAASSSIVTVIGNPYRSMSFSPYNPDTKMCAPIASGFFHPTIHVRQTELVLGEP